MLDLNALSISHSFIRSQLKEGALCIDATAGRGRDTAFLCSVVGESGRVLAFDIQQEAVDDTNALLKSLGYENIASVFCQSHSNMDRYAENESVDCIVFNFGWLPGGDHNIFTMPETSIEAIEKGLALLKSGGFMSLCIYYGRETGFRERDALLEYFNGIDSRVASVIVSQFVNRPNCPAIPVFILKN